MGEPGSRAFLPRDRPHAWKNTGIVVFVGVERATPRELLNDCAGGWPGHEEEDKAAFAAASGAMVGKSSVPTPL